MSDYYPIFALGTFTALVVGAAWAIVKYVNDKFARAEKERKDGDLIIHDRVNKVAEGLSYEKGCRETKEKIESQSRN